MISVSLLRVATESHSLVARAHCPEIYSCHSSKSFLFVRIVTADIERLTMYFLVLKSAWLSSQQNWRDFSTLKRSSLYYQSSARAVFIRLSFYLFSIASPLFLSYQCPSPMHLNLPRTETCARIQTILLVTYMRYTRKMSKNTVLLLLSYE